MVIKISHIPILGMGDEGNRNRTWLQDFERQRTVIIIKQISFILGNYQTSLVFEQNSHDTPHFINMMGYIVKVRCQIPRQLVIDKLPKNIV